MPIENYLPPSGSLVRFRHAPPDQPKAKPRLVPVEDVAALAAEHLEWKTSVSYAAHRGGQKDHHVTEEVSVAVDLDGIATGEQVERLRQRFPGAAAIRSNGVTLLYRIPAGSSWESLVPFALQVGTEAEKITGLEFDFGCLIRGDGTPAAHKGHLFRYPVGWADERGGPVEYFEPVDSSRSLVADAAGLAHPLPAGGANKNPGKGRSVGSGGVQKRGGSIDTSKCSALLKARFAALRAGKSVEEAAAIAAAAVGVPVADVEALYSRDGFEAPEIREVQRFTAADDSDYGVFGLVASKRGIQHTFTWWGNFGHSAQGFWDVCRDVETAFQGFLHFPELKVFCDHFRREFGKDWQIAMREDLERLHRKFGEFRGARRDVSERCLDRIRKALANGAASAVELKRRSRVSLRQTKRALVELANRSEVISSGKTKAKRWSLSTNNSCHTGNSREGMSVRLSVLTPEHRVGGKPVVCKKVRRAKGCPKNTKATREQFNATRTAGKAARQSAALAAKDNISRGEIIALAIPDSAKKYWLSRPSDFRLVKGWWYSARRKRPGISSLEQNLRQESLSPCLVARLRRAAARRSADAAANREIDARNKAAAAAAAAAATEKKVEVAKLDVSRAVIAGLGGSSGDRVRRVRDYLADWQRRVDAAGGFAAAVESGSSLVEEPWTELT